MRRKSFLLCVGAGVLASVGVRAQQPARIPHVGLLSFEAAPTPSEPDVVERSLQQALRELGYVEGKNIVLERRWAAGSSERLAALADALVRAKVDVIVAGGQPAREAARKATATIPILTLSGSDPVREGWAQSLAHPGGNVTGLTFTFPELGPKRLELLKEASPTLGRVAVLIDPLEVVDAADVVRETQAGAARLGLEMHIVRVHGADGLEAAFAVARQQRAQAVFPIAAWPHRARIAALAVRNRMLSIGESAEEARDGFLLAYGVDVGDLVRRAVGKVDKILKGVRAGDLPIERPTKFRLSVNVKTARALGVTIPQSLLARADEVIE